jgi:hypothetical protein
LSHVGDVTRLAIARCLRRLLPPVVRVRLIRNIGSSAVVVACEHVVVIAVARETLAGERAGVAAAAMFDHFVVVSVDLLPDTIGIENRT